MYNKDKVNRAWRVIENIPMRKAFNDLESISIIRDPADLNLKVPTLSSLPLIRIFLITYPRLNINLPRASAFLGTAPIHPLQKPRFRRERVPVPVDFDPARGRCLTSGNVNEVRLTEGSILYGCVVPCSLL